ncbi:MAG: bifunctional nuclease domain-containing protein [Desulfurococcaceae archaeon]
MGRTLRVEEVAGEFVFDRFIVARIVCKLEDGRLFFLDRVPEDVVLFLLKLRGEQIGDDRERLGDVLMSMPEVVEALGRHLKRVVINEFNEERGFYAAEAEFEDGGITVARKMVPSHAIMLALIANRPIYVDEELVEGQEQL